MIMKGVTSIERKGALYYYARIDGDRVYCGKGPKGRNMAEAARSKYVTRQYESKEVRAGLTVKKAALKTVKELSNWYMTLPSVQDLKSYDRKVDACAHILRFFGNKPVGQAEGDEQERYRQHRLQKGAMDGTINLEIKVLSTMYHTALKRKLISAEAMPGEFVQKKADNPRRIVTDAEFKKLLEHADPDFRDVLVCGYESAMRSSEICNLTKSQIRLGMQHISGGLMDYIDLGIFDTKTGARRTVPVSDTLKEVFQRRIDGLEPDDWVFTSRGRKYNRELVRNKMWAVCTDAGVIYGDKAVDKKGARIGVVFHCLRHTRTTKWVEMGFSDEIIRRATGHRSLEAYQRYVKLDPHAVMRLVSKEHKNGIKTTKTRIISGS